MKSRPNIKVLIIEDNEQFSELAFEVFEGCHRARAFSAEEGLLKFQEQCPDITLLDIGLPDKSGLELLHDLIRYDPEAFIVMLTASNIAKDVEYAKSRGAAGYITKPFSYKKVDDCIALYFEYKKKLEQLSPDERANNIIKELRVIELDEALSKQHIISKTEQEKLKQEVFNNWNILFVDDSENNRIKAQTQLQELGCIVDIAASGYDALKQTTEKQYDMVFMDSEMKDMDGYLAAESIRRTESELKRPAAVIIGLIEKKLDIQDSLWHKAGMNNFVMKPAKFSELRSMVDKYISESDKLSQN